MSNLEVNILIASLFLTIAGVHATSRHLASLDMRIPEQVPVSATQRDESTRLVNEIRYEPIEPSEKTRPQYDPVTFEEAIEEVDSLQAVRDERLAEASPVKRFATDDLARYDSGRKPVTLRDKLVGLEDIQHQRDERLRARGEDPNTETITKKTLREVLAEPRVIRSCNRSRRAYFKKRSQKNPAVPILMRDESDDAPNIATPAEAAIRKAKARGGLNVQSQMGIGIRITD